MTTGADIMTTPEEHAQWSSFTQSPENTHAPIPNPTGDQHGRFLTGNSGGGRRKGSRNKLTERFLDTIADDFAEHGAEAIAKVRIDDPAMYLKIVGSLLPRELIMQREESPPVDYAELSDEELVEVIDRRRRQKFVEDILKSVR
jgi:catalase (peroxidase I)